MEKITDKLVTCECSECNRKGRVYKIEHIFQTVSERYYCRKCAIKEIKKENKEFKKLVKECNKCNDRKTDICNKCNRHTKNYIDDDEFNIEPPKSVQTIDMIRGW